MNFSIITICSTFSKSVNPCLCAYSANLSVRSKVVSSGMTELASTSASVFLFRLPVESLTNEKFSGLGTLSDMSHNRSQCHKCC